MIFLNKQLQHSWCHISICVAINILLMTKNTLGPWTPWYPCYCKAQSWQSRMWKLREDEEGVRENVWFRPIWKKARRLLAFIEAELLRRSTEIRSVGHLQAQDSLIKLWMNRMQHLRLLCARGEKENPLNEARDDKNVCLSLLLAAFSFCLTLLYAKHHWQGWCSFLVWTVRSLLDWQALSVGCVSSGICKPERDGY